MSRLMLNLADPVEISVVCPVTRNSSDLDAVHAEFREVLARTARSVEFVYVIDGQWTGAEDSLSRIVEADYPVRVLRMAKGFGEATALQVGFEHSRGQVILTIPDRHQIDAEVLARVLKLIDAGEEAVVTRRDPRNDVWFNRVQSRTFHWLVKRLVWQGFRDMTCGVRGFTREAALRLELYGDQHRFIPVIAARSGHRVPEIPGAQHPNNRELRLRGPGVYLRRLLDILNIFFLARFTRKPLRFFGLIGSAIGFAGFLICAYLVVYKLLGHGALSNRPLLLLGVLLLVLGVQVVSIGLIGEIIIFLSPRRESPQVEELRAQGATADLVSEV